MNHPRFLFAGLLSLCLCSDVSAQQTNSPAAEAPTLPADPKLAAAKIDIPESKTLFRPAKPENPPNREEFNVRPDKDGRILFNFHGQPWPGVLVWLARMSDLSLDWQELPSGYLNLRTTRPRTIEEARDLLNRHLLDRGFTLLRHGEVLSVVNIKKLDPSLVPRISAADLDTHYPHEFVKVLFGLDSLTAEGAQDELKPMLSPNGRLSPLKKTNRIEAIDAVANLREIRNVLSGEQTQGGRQRLVREFKLVSVRADDVRPLIQELLGLDLTPGAPPGGGRNSAHLALQRQLHQQQQQLQQLQRQVPPPPGTAPPPQNQPKGPPIHLIVNPRENSILAHAPADIMAVIAETIRLLDVPSSIAGERGFLQGLGQTHAYRLKSLEPDSLISMLEKIGQLHPSTWLQVDRQNRSVIASAPVADHLKIQTLVLKLDNGGQQDERRFEVIRLRRLEANFVAGKVELMLGAARTESPGDSKRFRVDADADQNRLLLWGTDTELQDVRRLLVKLGEVVEFAGPAVASHARVVDAQSPAEFKGRLERLQQIWPELAPNPLQIDPRLVTDSARPTASVADVAKQAGKKWFRGQACVGVHPAKSEEEPSILLSHLAPFPGRQPTDPKTSGSPLAKLLPVVGQPWIVPDLDPATSLDRSESATDSTPSHLTAAAAPPIRIDRRQDGEVVISSDDTEELDRVEGLLTELAPPIPDYKIFRMKQRTTSTTMLAANLKEFFDEKERIDRRNRFGTSAGMPISFAARDDRDYVKKHSVKFIADANSIMVMGADARQLKTIEDLIAAYDVPEKPTPKVVRKTRVIKIIHSKARVIADAVKDVNRDLLGANDPALAGQPRHPNEAVYTYAYDGSDGKQPDPPLQYRGLLAIGVDETSNMLILSASEALLDQVEQTISRLDVPTDPPANRVRLIKVRRNIDLTDLQKQLKILNTKAPKP